MGNRHDNGVTAIKLLLVSLEDLLVLQIVGTADIGRGNVKGGELSFAAVCTKVSYAQIVYFAKSRERPTTFLGLTLINYFFPRQRSAFRFHLKHRRGA